MKAQKIMKKLKEEGYKDVYVMENKANEIYERHNHPWETKLVILDGEIKMNNKLLKEGDEITIKVKEFHEAIVGPEGCKYIVGRIK